MEQAGYHVGLRPDPEDGYVAVAPAFPGCYSQGERAKDGSGPLERPAPRPDEFSAEADPLAWEGEGWS